MTSVMGENIILETEQTFQTWNDIAFRGWLQVINNLFIFITRGEKHRRKWDWSLSSQSSQLLSYLLVGIQGRSPLGYIAGRLCSANTANIFIFQMLIIFDRCLYLWQTFPKPHLPNLIKICGDICCYFPQCQCKICKMEPSVNRNII